MELNQTTFDVLKAVAANKGNRFASLKGYESEKTGKVADYTILIGFSYHNAVIRSMEQLKAMEFKEGTIEAVAHQELIESCATTLASHAVGRCNPNYTCKDVYEDVTLDGELVNGVRYCRTTGNFNLSGLVQTETVIKSGVFKVVKSAEKTIAKGKIEKQLAKSKLRTFTIHESKLTTAKINGETIEM